MKLIVKADSGLTGRARLLLSTLDVIPLGRTHVEQAGSMFPAGLRTLDALHLAVALDMGPALLGFVTYDDRQALAAREHAITVVRPS